ncbi:hypothetical protein EON65_45840 [archaeon]|nr:MAG: hypothetical protein EON65_45840 [archaeon]
MKQWVTTIQSGAKSGSSAANVTNEWAKRTHSNSESTSPDPHPAVKKKRVLPPSMQNLTHSRLKKPFQLTDSHSLNKNASRGFKNREEEVIDLKDTQYHTQQHRSPTNPSETINLDKEYSLSSSQKQVLDTIAQGHSVFFTGAAGTGKSYILSILQEMGKAAGE